MALTKVSGGWVNVALVDEVTNGNSTMITERKSKYKYKVMFDSRVVAKHTDIQEWCQQSFGPGGRSRKLRWRFGWTDKHDTYYFKSEKDAMLFALRWADA